MDGKLFLQLAGVCLGLLYLRFEYRADWRVWVVGLIMPLVHGTLYFRSGLYADCVMEGYYILAGLYGMAVWRGFLPSRRGEKGERFVRHAPLCLVPRLVGAYTVAHAAIYFLLSHFTNSTVPFFDSLTTALSIVAMWMLSRKFVEQRLVWIVEDSLTVGLYLYKDIPLTVCLHLLYAVLAVAGFRRWCRRARAA